MLRIFGITLFMVSAALIGGANAGPFTYYTNLTAWSTATASDPVGSFPGTFTATDIFTTAETDGRGICCTSNITTIRIPAPNSNFLTFSLDLSALGEAGDRLCFAVPNCTFTSATPTDVIIPFSTPIVGFYSTMATTGAFGGPPAMITTFDAAGVLEAMDVLPFIAPATFFGVTFGSSVYSIDFGPSFLLSDFTNNNLVLDIEVAFADEPSAFACLLAALLIFSIASARFTRSR